MKTIAGAILMLVASIYATMIVFGSKHPDNLLFCLGLGAFHFLLGLYFLFAKDKPNN